MLSHSPSKTTVACFEATIRKIGINPYVDVPKRVSAALGRRGYVPIRGTIDGHAFKAGLVSLGAGRHRLFVNGAMRSAARVGVGDRIAVTLEYDPAPRTQPVPKKLRVALAANPAAKVIWDSLVPSKRKEILSYLNSLKRPKTVDRIVGRIITHELPKLAEVRRIGR